ncbi:MmcQ/YjbR family DNA-binding protein OS=Streptomyces microflavus OX=1919 GN=Smic_72670 PE=4 SV=1 [Streptomyces microflavus]
MKCPKEDRAELIAAEPEKFFSRACHYHYAWMRVRSAALEDAGELAAVPAHSWRQVARAGCRRSIRSWRVRGRGRGRAEGGCASPGLSASFSGRPVLPAVPVLQVVRLFRWSRLSGGPGSSGPPGDSGPQEPGDPLPDPAG